jgi:hypothetical protein
MDYVLGVINPNHLEGAPYPVTVAGVEEKRRTYISYLNDMTYVYAQPLDPGARHGTCAHAWYADRGEWMYALEHDQVNAMIPASFPTWMRTLGHTVSVASGQTRLAGNGPNCCLVSHGSSSAWTFGEDPWHAPHVSVSELFVRPGVTVTVRNKAGVGIVFDPLPGSIVTWRGTDWTVTAKSTAPFYRMSFRVIDPNRELVQRDRKFPHRLAHALRDEQRIVPLHLDLAGYEDISQGRRPGPSKPVIVHAAVANKKSQSTGQKKKAAPTVAKESTPLEAAGRDSNRKLDASEPVPKKSKKAPPPRKK